MIGFHGCDHSARDALKIELQPDGGLIPLWTPVVPEKVEGCVRDENPKVADACLGNQVERDGTDVEVAWEHGFLLFTILVVPPDTGRRGCFYFSYHPRVHKEVRSSPNVPVRLDKQWERQVGIVQAGAAVFAARLGGCDYRVVILHLDCLVILPMDGVELDAHTGDAREIAVTQPPRTINEIEVVLQ